MPHLSSSAKEAIVKKALGLNDCEMQKIAKQHNIGFSSLKRWIRQSKSGVISRSNQNGKVNKLSREDKFQHILATAALDAEAVGVYCRERGLYTLHLEEWKSEFMRDTNDERYQTLLNEIKTLRIENKELKQDIIRKERALAETAALLVLKKKSASNLGGSRGRLISSAERLQAIALIKQACLEGARKEEACKILGLSLRTVERWEKTCGEIDKRQWVKKNPKNKLTEEERDMLLAIANAEQYQDLPPCKIVPKLADDGKYVASESSFYRILREKNQLSHRGHSKCKSHCKPKSFIARGPNQVWSWDISYLPTVIRGNYFYLYFVIDIYSRKIVGWNIHETESSLYASYLITQACNDEKIKQHQIVLHSDNGSPMKGATMLTTLEKLGVLPSFSRPSCSNDNPYSEALFKTAKYHPSFPLFTKFATITDARIWCEKFVKWYNNEHLHSALKFVTPQERHSGLDKTIRAKRHTVYQMAKSNHPERWSGNIRNWTVPDIVTLNPDKKYQSMNDQGTHIEQNRLPSQERQDGVGEGSRQAANAARQHGYTSLAIDSN